MSFCTQYNNTQPNDIWCNNILPNNTQHNGILLNNTQSNYIQHSNNLSVMTLSVKTL
jgi:hypothetical protein